MELFIFGSARFQQKCLERRKWRFFLPPDPIGDTIHWYGHWPLLCSTLHQYYS